MKQTLSSFTLEWINFTPEKIAAATTAVARKKKREVRLKLVSKVYKERKKCLEKLKIVEMVCILTHTIICPHDAQFCFFYHLLRKRKGRIIEEREIVEEKEKFTNVK